MMYVISWNYVLSVHEIMWRLWWILSLMKCEEKRCCLFKKLYTAGYSHFKPTYQEPQIWASIFDWENKVLSFMSLKLYLFLFLQSLYIIEQLAAIGKQWLWKSKIFWQLKFGVSNQLWCMLTLVPAANVDMECIKM
jgi:hypothetical protein